ICHRTIGDTGETLAKLLVGYTENRPLSLESAELHYIDLQSRRKTIEKVELLVECFRRYRPETLKYFIKVITGGMRIGLQEKMVAEAIALAEGLDSNEVHDARGRSGDLTEVALAARAGTLASIDARLFHPLDFMLAKPLDSLFDLADPGEYIVEDKYDGIRAQIHHRSSEL